MSARAMHILLRLLRYLCAELCASGQSDHTHKVPRDRGALKEYVRRLPEKG
jgi:hypothetical protein